ncbi:MAG: rhomboid family intramembrane serine protease [bacterium]|nr:rhomboid family intramembrane serine protease [bacterium]
MTDYLQVFVALRPAEVEHARGLLDDAGIPYRTGLLPGDPPRVVFSVPEDRLEEAREILEAPLDSDAAQAAADATPAMVISALRILVSVVVLHVALVWLNAWVGGNRLLEWGALIKGGTMLQPWRLVTSLLLHADVPHALWNGISMTVFGLPLLLTLRRDNTALVYFAAGVGGAVSALAFADAGTRIVGSSGAVAGLFGAWVIVTFDRARDSELVGRARIRTIGIALLFLPSLLSPISSTGSRISVSSHLGGLVTGMVIGMLISRGLLLRWKRALEESRRIE